MNLFIDVDVDVMAIDVHHSLSSDNDDNLKDMPSLVEVSTVVEQNKQTSPEGDLVPLVGLAISNSFSTLPLMDNALPQKQKIWYAYSLEQSQTIHVQYGQSKEPIRNSLQDCRTIPAQGKDLQGQSL